MDLVLLGFLANDFALDCEGGVGASTCFGAASLRGLVSYFRGARPRDPPTVAIVDTLIQANARSKEQLTPADFRESHRRLARDISAPLVDTVYETGGRFGNATDQAIADYFALHLAPPIRAKLDDALSVRFMFGHYPFA